MASSPASLPFLAKLGKGCPLSTLLRSCLLSSALLQLRASSALSWRACLLSAALGRKFASSDLRNSAPCSAALAASRFSSWARTCCAPAAPQPASTAAVFSANQLQDSKGCGPPSDRSPEPIPRLPESMKKTMKAKTTKIPNSILAATSGREKYTPPHCGCYIAGRHISGGITHQDKQATWVELPDLLRTPVFSACFQCIFTMFQQLVISEMLESQLSEESHIRLNLNCPGVGRVVAAAIRVTETTPSNRPLLNSQV